MSGRVRALAAEALGTSLLLMAIVGSAIMADRLSDEPALILLCNSIATGAALFALIAAFGPISGAHFNPIVTIAALIDGDRATLSAAGIRILVQIASAVAGVWIAHLMFDQPALQVSSIARSGSGQWLAEGIATFGLVITVRLMRGRDAPTTGAIVGAYIASAFWFTSSTSFANPAVTIARSLTGSVAGLRPIDVPMFVVVQLVAGLAAAYVGRWIAANPRA